MTYTPQIAGAFNPTGNTITFVANTTAPTPVQCVSTSGTSYNQYRIFNSGSNLIFIGVGANAVLANTNATVVSSSNTGLPVLPGTLEIFSFPANIFFTAITTTGNSVVYVTPGLGM